MSNVTNFTPEELNLIREIIPLTGFAVAVAGNSGIIERSRIHHYCVLHLSVEEIFTERNSMQKQQ